MNEQQYNILGIGTDIIEIERIAMAISRHGDRFLNRIFTPKEQEYAFRHHAQSTATFAGRFAAKEAISKALGTGIREGVSWKSIEILNDSFGKPIVHLSNTLIITNREIQQLQILLSISHCKMYATAFAVCTQIIN